MKSARPKVLHQVAHRTMLEHVLQAAHESGIERRFVVTGPGMDEVLAAADSVSGTSVPVIQKERRGTGHAVLTARDALNGHNGAVVVLFGDTPLIRSRTITAMMDGLNGADIAVLGFYPDDPTGYGRLVTDAAGELLAIREQVDASEEERAIGFCFSGLMAFASGADLALLDRLTTDNAQGELYLTDVVGIARHEGRQVVTAVADPIDVMGVNSRAELAEAEHCMQQRLRDRAMTDGATLVAPETVFLASDTRLGRDTLVEPNVVFGPGVTVGEGAQIRAFSHLEGAQVADGAQIGPYARLRPGAEIGEKARIGNFVEVKNTRFGAGAKANHLTYLGDADVGQGVNIGAGTITCNYDGYLKYRTTIGDGVFVGSNSSLVAPVTVGGGAYVASGSVVTHDVPEDALAIGRGRQEDKTGWAARFRARQEKARASKSKS